MTTEKSDKGIEVVDLPAGPDARVPTGPDSDRTTASQRSRTGVLSRMGGLMKDHPGASLLVAAGASALFAGELAVGAVIGIGATLLVTRGDPARRRRLLDRGRVAFDAGAQWARDLVRGRRDNDAVEKVEAAPAAPPAANAAEPSPTEPSASR